MGWRLMGGHPRSWRVQLRSGEKAELPTTSRMTWRVAFEGSYDRPLVDLAAGYIRPDTLVLDVGASLGLWTVQLGGLARKRGAQVWAFEPNPDNVHWLERNVSLNELQTIVAVQPVGLGERDGIAHMLCEPGGVGNGSIANGQEGTEVAIKPLDSFQLPAPVSFIKLDVEGYESAVLRGARALIARDRPVVVGEFSEHWRRERGDDLRFVVDDLGYDAFALSLSRSRPWRSEDTVSVSELLDGPLPENLLLRPHQS